MRKNAEACSIESRYSVRELSDDFVTNEHMSNDADEHAPCEVE